MDVYSLIKNVITHYKSSFISLLSDRNFVFCDIKIKKPYVQKDR